VTRLEIGAGENPTVWAPVAQARQAQAADAPLGDIPAGSFRGAPVWQIRPIVQRANGATKEARFRLAVG
jgi:hypothetical protein